MSWCLLAHLLCEVIGVVLHDHVDLGLAKFLPQQSVSLSVNTAKVEIGILTSHLQGAFREGDKQWKAVGDRELTLHLILPFSDRLSRAFCACAFLTPNCAR